MNEETIKKNYENNKNVLLYIKPDLGLEYQLIMELMCEVFEFESDNIDWLVNYFSVNSIPRIENIDDSEANESGYVRKIYSTYSDTFGCSYEGKLSYEGMFELYTFYVRDLVEDSIAGNNQAKFELFSSVWPNYKTFNDSEIKIRSSNSNINYLKNAGFFVSPNLDHSKALLGLQTEDDNYDEEVDKIAKDYQDTLTYLNSVADLSNYAMSLRASKIITDQVLGEKLELHKNNTKEFVDTTLFNNIFRGIIRSQSMTEHSSHDIPVYHKFFNFTSLLSLFGVEFNTYSRFPTTFTDEDIIERGCAMHPFFKSRSCSTYMKNGCYKVTDETASVFNTVMIDRQGVETMKRYFSSNIGNKYKEMEPCADNFNFLDYMKEIKVKRDSDTLTNEERLVAEDIIGVYAKSFYEVFDDPTMSVFAMTEEDSACILLKNIRRYKPENLVGSAIASGKVQPMQVNNSEVFVSVCQQMFEVDFCNHLYRLGFLLKLFFNTEISGLDMTFYKKTEEIQFLNQDRERQILDFLKVGYDYIDRKISSKPEVPKPYGNMKPFSFKIKIQGNGHFIRLVDLPARFTDDGFASIYSTPSTPDTSENDIPLEADSNFFMHVMKCMKSLAELDLLSNKEVDNSNLTSVFENTKKFVDETNKDMIKDLLKKDVNDEDVMAALEKLVIVPLDERYIVADMFSNLPNIYSYYYYSNAKAAAKYKNDTASYNGYIDYDTDIEAINEIVKILNNEKGEFDDILGKEFVNMMKMKQVKVVDSKYNSFNRDATLKSQRKPD